ncbi:hypothetical protein V5N11_008721 [Cardamine amara subsp. amara]|uniref:Retrotransposon gag domain-containing protein n=1 Tax=Cardamine amara subsp. amara TaxID=228776 RepID=A0ABD1AKW6_CARAN
MEGDALHWLQWLRQQNPALTWPNLKVELMEQFGGDITASPCEQLAALRQYNSVDDFVNEFRARAAQIPNLDPQLQLGIFLNGLKEDIRVKIRPNEASDLRTAIRVARSIEKELDFSNGGKKSNRDKTFKRYSTNNNYNGSGSTFQRTNLLSTGSVSTTNSFGKSADKGKPNLTQNKSSGSAFSSTNSTGNNIVRPRGIRQYSHQEFLEMKNKGLCFRCKQPYSPLHDCPYKSIRALMLAEDESSDDGEIRVLDREDYSISDLPPINEAHFTFLHLPLNTLSGIDSPQTMKFKGTLDGETVVIMVDSGASHNFISSKLAHKLHRKIEPTKRFKVRLGDGRKEDSEGKFSGLPIHIGSEQILVNCYLFTLGGIDIIFGVEWLASLGDVQANWTSMVLSFSKGGKKIKLCGDPSLARSEVSVNALNKLQEVDFCVWLWHIADTQFEGNSQIEITTPDHVKLDKLLTDFQEIFGDPTELPPARSGDHQITLKPSAGAVNVRPYRYGHN